MHQKLIESSKGFLKTENKGFEDKLVELGYSSCLEGKS